MEHEKFNGICQQQLKEVLAVLELKRKEYAPGDDRLISFKTTAGIAHTTPENVCFMQMMKHVGSLGEMVRDPHKFGPKIWKEKITDAQAYLCLLMALTKEEDD